jgi:hypothetical protein
MGGGMDIYIILATIGFCIGNFVWAIFTQELGKAFERSFFQAGLGLYLAITYGLVGK